MNQKQALTIGRNACHIFKTNGRWVLSRPWKSTDPQGPKTQTSVASYAQARVCLAVAIADVAMEQMLEGEDKDIRQGAYYTMAYDAECYQIGRPDKLLRIALRDAKEENLRLADCD